MLQCLPQVVLLITDAVVLKKFIRRRVHTSEFVLTRLSPVAVGADVVPHGLKSEGR